MNTSRIASDLPVVHLARSLVPLKVSCYDCIHNAIAVAMSETSPPRTMLRISRKVMTKTRKQRDVQTRKHIRIEGNIVPTKANDPEDQERRA